MNQFFLPFKTLDIVASGLRFVQIFTPFKHFEEFVLLNFPNLVYTKAVFKKHGNPNHNEFALCEKL